MKVGIMLPNYAQWLGSRELKDVVRRAEALGYDSLWVNDHVLLPAERAALYGNGFKDPYPVLAYCAALSDTLLLGTSVSVVPYRNPIVTAKMVASIDVLSEGRVIFGVGSGHEPGESQALGLPYEDRGAMTDEYLRAMIAVWTQELCEFHGRYVDFSATKPILKPVQQPYPPIHVGGRSRRAMRRAVELGQAWHPSALSPEQLEERITSLKEMASGLKRAEPVEVSLRWAVHLVETPPAEGVVSGRGETQRRQMTAETAARTLRRYQELGVSHITIDFPAHRIGNTPNVEVFAGQMERFAQEVRPAVGPSV
jgi:probable F420-dependent oxidoreductase